jgi:predicted AAA+ superfamily ATPase
MYIKRKIDSELQEWKYVEKRKPLLLRGARQVGKSTIVREFSKKFDYFVEINFDKSKEIHSIFEGNLFPKEICNNISTIVGIPIIPGKTLLFFDEIQSCIPAISSLRYFYEDYPELHLIAAGSLLEFALEELPSFGVGRIRSLFVYPFSFDEFLFAQNEMLLVNAIKNAGIENPLHESIHLKLLKYLKQFLIVGGMPEAVAEFSQTKDFLKSQAVLDDLIVSLKDDFAKYKKRVPANRIAEVFDAIVEQQGRKFIYKKANSEANHKQLKEAVELLIMAGLVIPITHSSANGIPLGAEIDSKKRKLIIFDHGIFQRILGLKISDILLEKDFNLINKGSIAEIFVGLELLKSESCYENKQLYYWHRENSKSNAEVDYVIAKNDKIIPIEVKSGTKGSMQSMYVFLSEKKLDKGIRTSLENFGMIDKVEIWPLYAISEIGNKIDNN